ncbi:MAG: dihydroorotase [Deltaproteobacteria bacterium]|nr:dihydroorotase [Deltaproteobacteria bacterium]
MPSESFDLLIRGGDCAFPWGVQRADVAVKGGRIAAVGTLTSVKAERVIEAAGLTVLPGVIDSQVHFREPGFPHKEDLASGTLAAAFGGVTCVLEMPNTNPSTTTAAALADKVARTRGRVHVDIGFFVGAAPESAPLLRELERAAGCAGVKVFMGSSTGTLLVEDEELLRLVFRNGSRRVAIHAEDEARLRERKDAFAKDTALAHPVWRDEMTALLATQRCLRVAKETGRRVHVLHITTAEEMQELAQHRALATVEVTPQHLTLAAPDCYERLGTFAQMNPPIREQRHQDALWKAVQEGLVDVVASDHAPHTREEKAKPYPQSPSGMPGVQTLLPVMLNHVHAGRLSLQRLVDLVCAGPARVYGMARKGRLVLGNDADFTLVDLKREVTLTHAMMKSTCGWTPYDGMRVVGWPVSTIVRGHEVMREQQLLGAPVGQLVEFEETQPA